MKQMALAVTKGFENVGARLKLTRSDSRLSLARLWKV